MPVFVSWAAFLGVTAVTVLSLSWLAELAFDLRQVIRTFGISYFLMGPGLVLIALGCLIVLVLMLRASRLVLRPLPIAL